MRAKTPPERTSKSPAYYALQLAMPDSTFTIPPGADWDLKRIDDTHVEAHWPAVLAGLALLAGAFVLALGITGLAGMGRSRIGGFARRIRKLLHP